MRLHKHAYSSQPPIAMLNSSSLASFSRKQALYLSVAAVMVSVFWAVGQRINPATVVFYMLLLGNLATYPMARVRRMVSNRPFPYNWLLFLAGLFVLTPVIYIIASAVVIWIAPPTPQSLGHLIRTGWKFPCLALVVYGVLRFFYLENRGRLERRNAELLRSVELSAAQLAMQEQDLQRAREIQQSLLPKDIPQIPGFEVATAYQPARMVGGDYFDVLQIGEKRLAICIADVVGKGVAAALLMANVQAVVRAFATDARSPAILCSRVNGVLCGNIDIGKFVTFFYGILDGGQRTFQYCNAGHPRPILISGNSVQQLSEGGAVLGVFPDWKYEDAMIGLSPGDKLLLFTDGLTEVSGPDGQEFGEHTLAGVAKANGASTASVLNSNVLARVDEFCVGRFQDDVTLLVIAAS